MISDASVSAAERFTEVMAAARAYIVTARIAATDGLSWAEFGELLSGLLRVLVRIADTLDVPGPERKAIVMVAVGALFDAIADKTSSRWYYPFWVAIRPAVRALVLAIAAGTIEHILPLVRSAA